MLDVQPGELVPAALKDRTMDEAPIGITIADAQREDNPLIYVNRAFEELTGYSRAEMLGRNCRILQGPETATDQVARLAEAIDAAEPVTVVLRNYRRDGTPFWNEVTVAPVRDEDGTVTNYVGFQVDVTERKRARAAVERRREELEQLAARIRGLLRDVTELLMRSVSRPETERAVCERIIESDPYRAAAIAELDLASEALEVRSWAGVDLGTADERIELGTGGPVARAIDDRAVQLSTAAEAVPGFADQAPAVAIAPLAFGNRTYGALFVGVPDARRFTGPEVVVIEALGQTISIAINAVEGRRILSADHVVELTLRTSDHDLFFVAYATACDCRLEHKGTVPRADGTTSLFFRADEDPEVLLAAVEASGHDVDARIVSENESGVLVEFTPQEEPVMTTLAERGADVQAVTAENGTARIDLELPMAADPRGVVEWFLETFDGSELVTYRETDRPPKTKAEYLDDLSASLTDRQRAALKAAYVGGFYDDPRSITGDELADILDISRATYHQHRRAAERKVIGQLLER